IGDDFQRYGVPANLSLDLPTTIGTGVNGEALGITYSSPGDTVTAPLGPYDITGVPVDGTGRAADYSVTLTDGTLTVRTSRNYVVTNPDPSAAVPGSLGYEIAAAVADLQFAATISFQGIASGSIIQLDSSAANPAAAPYGPTAYLVNSHA